MEIAMQKEQSVIKFIIILLLSIYSSHQIYGQKIISGRYSNLEINQENYNYFNFNKQGLFEYHTGASLGDDLYGKGHYEIKNDSLILNYDLTNLNLNSYHNFKYYTNSKDSIIVKINTFNLDNKTLKGVTVGVLEKGVGLFSDKNGVAYLKLKKQNKDVEIIISGLCCQNYSFKIDTKYNYEINCFVKDSFRNPIGIRGEIEKYEIIENKNNCFKLKKENKISTFKKID